MSVKVEVLEQTRAPGGMSDDSESGPEEEYSHEYLKNCKRLRYFKSKNGNPALSITTGRLKFLTPIAHRTRSKIT